MDTFETVKRIIEQRRVKKKLKRTLPNYFEEQLEQLRSSVEDDPNVPYYPFREMKGKW
jgi:hypothetical protein